MVTSRRWALMAAGVIATLAAGCKEDRETQITVAITSETKVPEEIDTLEVVVTDAEGSERSRYPHPVEFQSFFPATLAIIPEDDASIGTPVQVDIRATKGGTNMVLRRAVVSFVQGRTLLLPMPLRMACFSIESCNATQTCAGGLCVPADADEDALPDYDPTLVFPDEAGETCFDEEACLPTSTEEVLDPTTCTFPVPDTENVNVSIRWLAAPKRVIALDAEDSVEGWVRLDATTGKLSEGVCTAVIEESPPNKALGVYVSSVCPPKRVHQPHCDRGKGGGVGAELAAP